MHRLYDRYIGYVMAVGLRYVPDRDEVRDVVQDSFVKIFSSISRFEYRGEGSLKGWMLRIVANEAISYAKAKTKFVFTDEVPDEPEADSPEVEIRGYASPEGSAELNARLSQARADAVRNILIKRYKISADRLTAKGMGATDKLFEQVEFFVDSVSDYKSDFILFPEYFNAPLMAKFNNMGEAQSIRQMAQYTEQIRDRFRELAISYNINIITGSMPYVKDDGALYNVGFLCRRDGSVDMYEKIHVTPDEQKCWGLTGGSRIQTFDTDCGKIGIVICYDVEFPELSRLMAQDGMQILFVPFMTDTQNAYSRVRVCAQARAIENECYVAIAGSVGNLPRVHNMDIQYAQSAVFTPCDFAFPNDGKRSEATPNTEMILVSDVDLNLLNELHTYGAVRNLRDRRKDLYELKKK